MFFLNYLSGTIKAAVLLIGLNGSSDKMRIEDAYQHLDARVQAIQGYYNFNDDTVAALAAVVNQAKREILKLSYQGQTLVQFVEKIEAELEQAMILGWPNQTIALPSFFNNVIGIYHFKANDQMDGVSCGYWTTANAKVIDNYLSSLNEEEQGFLNLEVINRNANALIHTLFANHTPVLLTPAQVNQRALNEKTNKKTLAKLAASCSIKDQNGYNKEGFRVVCENKLHIVQILAGQVSPCCLSTNQEVYLDHSGIIKSVIQKLTTDSNSFSMSLLDGLIAISSTAPMLNPEAIKQKKDEITLINWVYLENLINALDEDVRNKIICYVIDNRFASLISQGTLLNEIKKGLEKPLSVESEELLTLVNLEWMVANAQNQQKITHLQEIGSMGTFVYFKALSDHFKTLVNNNENGALHFACYIGLHWFLISVIHLKDKKPVVIIMDSMNEKISSDEMLDQYKGHDVSELSELINEENADSIKLGYILFFYDLFINENIDLLYKPLRTELAKVLGDQALALSNQDIIRLLLAGPDRIAEFVARGGLSQHRNGYHNEPHDDEAQMRRLSFIPSLEKQDHGAGVGGGQTSTERRNGNRKRLKNGEVCPSEGVLPPETLKYLNDEDREEYVKRGYDVSPNSKGKEK